MRREKFVKKLMGSLIPRNNAKQVAELIRSRDIPYKDCYIGYAYRQEDGAYCIGLLIPTKYARNGVLSESCTLRERMVVDLIPQFRSKNDNRSRIVMKNSDESHWWIRSPHAGPTAFYGVCPTFIF